MLENNVLATKNWPNEIIYLDSLLHHGIFAHKNISVSSHTSTNVLELLGSDVVSITDEDFFVLGQKTLGFFKVSCFPCLSIPFDHFEYGKGLVTWLLRIKLTKIRNLSKIKNRYMTSFPVENWRLTSKNFSLKNKMDFWNFHFSSFFIFSFLFSDHAGVGADHWGARFFAHTKGWWVIVSFPSKILMMSEQNENSQNANVRLDSNRQGNNFQITVKEQVKLVSCHIRPLEPSGKPW